MLKYKILKDGKLFGRYSDYRVWIYKRPHGSYCCLITFKGKLVKSEGYHGTFLGRNIKKVKDYANWHIKSHIFRTIFNH